MKKIDSDEFLNYKFDFCKIVAEWEILTDDGLYYYYKLVIGREKGDYYLIKSPSEYISFSEPKLDKCYKLSKNEFREYELKYSKFPELARVTSYDMEKIFPHLTIIGYNGNNPYVLIVDLVNKKTKDMDFRYDIYWHNDCLYATLWERCGHSVDRYFCLGEISKDFTFPKDSLLKVATQDYENYDFEIRTRKWFDSFKDK